MLPFDFFLEPKQSKRKDTTMGRICGVTAVTLIGLIGWQCSWGQQSVMSAAGFSGLSVTPNAHLLPWGSMALSYDNEVVGGVSTGKNFSRYGTSGHNFVVGFGMLPFLEVAGRLATNKIQANCYVEGCGLRDLSFNFKGGITLDSEKRWSIAAGATDFGGNVTVFRTMYGVLTYSPDNFDASIGYARRGAAQLENNKPLNGPFGSLAYKPTSFLSTHVEYNDGKAWTGARIFAPSGWLPAGWEAHLSANFRIHGTEATSRSWFGLGVSIPLYKLPTIRTERLLDRGKNDEAGYSSGPDAVASSGRISYREFSADGLPYSAKEIRDESAVPGMSSAQVNSTASIPSPVSDDRLAMLAAELRAKGFEDIYVGRTNDGAVAVRVNNAVYNVNTLDALGVALGSISRTLSRLRAGYRLEVSQRQIAIVGISGQADCLADWIDQLPPRCIAGKIYTPGTSSMTSLMDGAAWVISGDSASWKTARFILQPVLRTGVGTDYGALDYSAGIRLTAQQPLWSGAYLEWSHVTPIGNSKDYGANAVYGNDRIISITDKILAHQVFRIPVEILFGESNRKTADWGVNALTAHVAAGRINSNYRGTYGELRWAPFEGQHRLGVEAGIFERTTAYDYVAPKKSRPILGSYRYSYEPTRTDFEVTAGQYLYNDRGAQFQVTQWFDDVSLIFYIRRTKYEYEKASRTFAGAELIIPLTPRKDMNPSYHVQITGTPRFSYSLETKVGGVNFISTTQGVFPGAASLDRVFNSDRDGVAYFENNMARIRSAAAQ